MAEDEDQKSELEKDFAALDIVSRSRLDFEQRISAASLSQSKSVLETLRLEKTYEFAQFYFSIAVMGLTGPDDASLLADFHNDQVEALLKDKVAMERLGLREDRLLKAIFTSDTRPRLELIWREKPGALDQSNLARFLVMQMSSESARKIAEACEAAGFVTRTQHAFGATVVCSTGVLERVLGESLRAMRQAIKSL